MGLVLAARSYRGNGSLHGDVARASGVLAAWSPRMARVHDGVVVHSPAMLWRPRGCTGQDGGGRGSPERRVDGGVRQRWIDSDVQGGGGTSGVGGSG
jgi:hypothetical protein